MSSLDQYSYCPCGNGKKIKFCKCNQHFAEMDKIHRMIVGEQHVAALDRINADLKTMPSEPWLLAMKCELLLRLREIDLLEETSAKFIRLQPDNPLAKLYRALLAIIRGNTEEGATLLLQAIGNSTEALPPMTATVALNLLESMAQRGMTLPALLHAEMLTEMGEGIAQQAYQAINSLTSQQNVNILSRESLPSVGSSDGEPYAERIAEAEALASSFRITEAKTKVESMLREFGPQAPLLQVLLYCQLMLSDMDGGGMTALKLAGIESLQEPQRIYYQALAYELNPRGTGVASNEELCQYVIEDPNFEETLLNNSHLAPIPPDQLRGLLSALLQEEVPPKHCFVCTDPILQEQFGELEAKRAGNWIAFYGKQTDKPARLITLESRTSFRRDLLEKIKKELGITGIKRELIETLPTTYITQTTASMLVKKQVAAERGDAFRAALQQIVIDSFLDHPVESLGNQSPRQAATDPKYRIPLLALLLHWQGSASSSLQNRNFKELHQLLNVTRPSIPASEDVFDLVGGAAYFWTDLSNIDPESLIQLMQSTLVRSVVSMFEDLIDQSSKTTWPEELKPSAEYTEVSLRAQSSTDPNETEKLLLRLTELGKKLGIPIGDSVLQRAEILNALGRTHEAAAYFQQAIQANPEDPILLQFLQMAMMREQQMQGRMAEGRGGVTADSATPAGGSSGLWTPDQPQESDSSGGSKLWIPGQ